MIQRQGQFNKKAYTLELFDSIDEYIKTIEARPIADAWKYNRRAQEVRRTDRYNDPSWSGAKNYNDAREQFIAGTKAKTELARVYNQTQTSRKRQTVAAPCGGAPIVANALRGIPNAMIDTRRKREPKTVRMVVNMTVSGMTRAEQITEAGRQIIAAAGRLDAQGIQTEIVCSNDHVLNGRQYASTAVIIKTAGHAFNAARVSFSMSSPAFLRVFLFAALSGNDKAEYDSAYGYALTDAVTAQEAAEYQRAIYGPAITINLARVIRQGAGVIDDAIKAWQAGR